MTSSQAVYLATISEPFDKMIRYGQGLTFFDRQAIGRRVFFGSLSNALQLRRHLERDLLGGASARFPDAAALWNQLRRI